MRYLIRRVPIRWANISEDKLWEDGDLPSEAIDHLYDGQGLSVWLTASSDERLDVAAAMSMEFSRIADFTWVGLKEDELKRIGVTIEREVGATPYKKINPLHRNLKFSSMRQFHKFAEIYKNSDMEMFPHKTVMERISALVKEDPELRSSITSSARYKKEMGEILDKHHQFIRTLFKTGALAFS